MNLFGGKTAVFFGGGELPPHAPSLIITLSHSLTLGCCLINSFLTLTTVVNTQLVIFRKLALRKPFVI